MQTLLLIALLGLPQEPPLQIPPPPQEAPASAPAPAPAPVPPPTGEAAPSKVAPPATPPVAPARAQALPGDPLSFFSDTYPYAWDRVIPLSIQLDGLKVSSIFFNKREIKPGFFDLFKGAEFGTRAQVEVTNTGKYPKVPGFSVAVLDKDGRLLGVASGGTKLGTVKPGETETFDLNFTQVKERLPFGDKFLLAIELRN